MNESHYNLLLGSVTEFNQFRMDNPDANIDLKGADFMGDYLRTENLSGLDLTGADLQNASFVKANLKNTDFSGANLSNTGFYNSNLVNTDFSGADLRNVSFQESDLTDAKLDYQIQKGLLNAIAEKVLNNPQRLEMSVWHSDPRWRSNTAHCLSGWACELNPIAKELEKSHDTEIAGLLTLGHEAHKHFFDSNEDGFEYLIKVIAK